MRRLEQCELIGIMAGLSQGQVDSKQEEPQAGVLRYDWTNSRNLGGYCNLERFLGYYAEEK